MEESSDRNSENLQFLLGEAKTIVTKEGSIDVHEKESLSKIVEQLDFVLGKHDVFFDSFVEVITSMFQFDFSKRLPELPPDSKDPLQAIVTGINLVNEEMQNSAVHKNTFHALFKGLAIENSVVIITNTEGIIYFVNSNSDKLNITENLLNGVYINSIFNNFKEIDERISKEGAVNNMGTYMNWNGELIPVNLNLAISVNLGKIYSLVYVIRINS